MGRKAAPPHLSEAEPLVLLSASSTSRRRLHGSTSDFSCEPSSAQTCTNPVFITTILNVLLRACSCYYGRKQLEWIAGRGLAVVSRRPFSNFLVAQTNNLSVTGTILIKYKRRLMTTVVPALALRCRLGLILVHPFAFWATNACSDRFHWAACFISTS